MGFLLVLDSIGFFVVGTAIGSFLNALAYRSVHGGSVFSGRSKCPHCKRQIEAKDLVPIISYLLLRGKCRYCKKKISLQYPIVELVTGLAFSFTFLYWNSQVTSLLGIADLAFLFFVVSVLIVLTVTDLLDGLLPNSLVLPSIGAVGLFKLFLVLTGAFTIPQFSADLAAALAVSLIFFAIVYLSNEKAMGGGDIKLAFLLGLILGWPVVAVGLFLGFLTGGFAAVMLLISGRKRFGQSLPLGPFLNLGAFISLFYGQQLIDTYLRAI